MTDKEKFDLIKNKIINSLNPDEIYVFGSFAVGKHNKDSDIDICIVKNGIKGLQNKIKCSSTIRDDLSGLNTALDILIFNKSEFNKRKSIFGSIQYEIAKKGKKLYEKRKKTSFI